MIPEAVAKRWAKCWPEGTLFDHPSWTMTAAGLRRCDGIVPVQAGILALGLGTFDPRGRWYGKESYDDFMTRIDREHPLPPPPPLEGQVWLDPESEESAMITAVWRDQGENWRIWTGCSAGSYLVGPVEVPGDTPGLGGIPKVRAWPLKGLILVAGPTPWGLVPWMDTRGKP